MASIEATQLLQISKSRQLSMSRGKPTPSRSSSDLDSPEHQSAFLDPSNHKTYAHEGQFEKNYPKNIFIPLTQYLAELGYKEAFEKTVGCREEFQGKNVVSLSQIYSLLSQDWFVRNIDKEQALTHISNKILLNSKIKKKMFHLLIAHLILLSDFSDCKEFRRKISKEAIMISKKPMPNDETFAYPNIIIYLLQLFRKILLAHANKKSYNNKLEDQFSKMSLEDGPGNPQSIVGTVPNFTPLKTKAVGSKEQYKFYVKQIVHLLAGTKILAPHIYTDILQESKQTILQKQKLFRERYRLVEGIPNWYLFVELVVVRCFEYKRKDLKVTNFVVNQWVSDCKNKMLSVADQQEKGGSQHKQEKNKKKGQEEQSQQNNQWMGTNIEFTQKWSAVPLPLNLPAGEPVVSGTSGNVAKHFSPIILTAALSQHQ